MAGSCRTFLFYRPGCLNFVQLPCVMRNHLFGISFQPFENVETILCSWAAQKQVMGRPWPGCGLLGPAGELPRGGRVLCVLGCRGWTFRRWTTSS